jgi:TPR repeat protein
MRRTELTAEIEAKPGRTLDLDENAQLRQKVLSSRKELLRSAKAGDTGAQFELACSLDFERPSDTRRAAIWYRRAAEQGHAEAQNNLGEYLRDEIGTRTALKEAVAWFRKAADQGYPDAQLSLGYAHYKGEGVPRDWDEALKWYRRSARQGNVSAQANIGHMYHDGEGVTQDDKAALRWLMKAAKGGNLKAMYWIEDYFPGPVGTAWLKRAAKAGLPDAQVDLGVCYMNGEGVPKNVDRAVEWYRRAAAQADTWAWYLLGLCYRDGEGVGRNRRIATSWFNRAAAAGVREAATALDRMQSRRS